MFGILRNLSDSIISKQPILGLGKDISEGNVIGGFQTFAERQFGPQMNFLQSMANPNATGRQRFDAALGMTGAQPFMNMLMRPENNQVAQGLRATTDGQGLRLPGIQNTRMPISTGLPNYGLLPFISQ